MQGRIGSVLMPVIRAWLLLAHSHLLARIEWDCLGVTD